MTRRRPRIGITGPDTGGFPAWVCTALAVWRASGVPVRLTPNRFADKDIPPLDALVIGGGADVDPGRYGADPDSFSDVLPESGERHLVRRVATWLIAPFLYYARKLLSLSASAVDPARDAFEEQCLAHALDRGLPVLGICRGSQFLNVHFGGTLYTNLAGYYGEVGNVASVTPRKRIRIRRGSRLHRVMRSRHARVNSLHKQAVRDLGDGIVVVARDDSGVVQAIEHRDLPFVLGVQWHPEYLPLIPVQQKLFRALVRHAREARNGD